MVVVSPRKCGTHLARELLVAFGYRPYGQVAPADSPMPLGPETVWRILRYVYSPDELAALAELPDVGLARQRVAQGLDAYLRAWWDRLGVAELPSAAGPRAPAALVARVRANPAAGSFFDTPEGLCWFLHQLDQDRVDVGFLQHWAGSDQPRIVLIHRDPRDALVSMVQFLAEADPSRVGVFADHHAYAVTMRGAASVADRLTIALNDPHFPGADEFHRALWLLHHPRVAKVRFDELVGPAGGGSVAAQRAAVSRLADFLGVRVEVPAVAERLYNPAAHTFRRGRVGTWREYFTAEHSRLFDARHGDVLHRYGYR